MAFSSVSSITLASRLQIHAHKSYDTHSELTVYTLASSVSLECWNWVTRGRFTTLHRFQCSLPAVWAPLKERVASSVGFAAKTATPELPFSWISSLWCHAAVLKSQLFNARWREFKIAALYLKTSRLLPSWGSFLTWQHRKTWIKAVLFSPRTFPSPTSPIDFVSCLTIINVLVRATPPPLLTSKGVVEVLWVWLWHRRAN